MCGFVVVVGQAGRSPDRAMIERMLATIAHRGPDDSGFWSSGQVAMGLRRLAILDRSSAAHQPMLGSDGHEVLVFNGEIYNYVELRAELIALGHRFRSTGDTEVLLAAWRQWGEACVDRLVGMFAFVLWDARRQTLFGARDHFGIKPLYVYRGRDVVIFASEIKAIHASGLCPPLANWKTIAGYLLNGQLDEGATTCFDGIEHIAPAHSFRLGLNGQLHQRRYFDWPHEPLTHAADVPDTLARLLEDSVRLQLRADLPAGVCLSGGLDSTAIVCEMARQRAATRDPAPLLAFNFNTPEYDESSYISETVRATGATLVQSHTSPEQMWDDMPRVMHYHDEPLHAMNVLVGFDLMRLARQHGAIVLLNGQGSDEVLGGYSSFYTDYWTTLVTNGQVRAARREMAIYARAFGVSRLRLEAQIARRLGFRTLSLIPWYDQAARIARRALSRRSAWITPDLAKEATDRQTTGSLRLGDTQRLSVMSTPLPLYLRVEDRNSMAHGVEARVPFLDHRLASYALALPLDWRIRGPWNKYGLREAMRGRIPESVRIRPDKLGFLVPTGRWFARPLYGRLHDLLASRSTRERGLYRTQNLLRELEHGRGTEVANHEILFRVANVETWLAMVSARSAEASRMGEDRTVPTIRLGHTRPPGVANRGALSTPTAE